MTETMVWFDPVRYAWIPGTALGLWGGLEGTLAGLLAPRGKLPAVWVPRLIRRTNCRNR